MTHSLQAFDGRSNRPAALDRGRESRLSRLPLPPNRTCRSPASGSPVSGLTHKGTDGPTRGDGASFHPAVGVETGLVALASATSSRRPSASARAAATVRLKLPTRASASPACIALAGTNFRFLSVAAIPSISTFLHPFAPPTLPGFGATMSALTPVPCLELAGYTGLYASRSWPSKPSVSNHPDRPHGRFITQPLSAMGLPPSRVRASPLARRLANRSGRIEFVILRTTSSLPVAPHPASRRRSFGSLQAGVGIPERDSHPSDQLRSRTHERATPVAHRPERSGGRTTTDGKIDAGWPSRPPGVVRHWSGAPPAEYARPLAR